MQGRKGVGKELKIPESYNQLDQWTTVMFLYNSALKAINTKIEIMNKMCIRDSKDIGLHIISKVKEAMGF